MTYEKFTEAMTKNDEVITRKDIKSFAIRYAILLAVAVFSISSVIYEIIDLFFSIVFLILSLFLYIWSFDIFVEQGTDYFIKVNKRLKLWWLYCIIIVAVCLLINLFII